MKKIFILALMVVLLLTLCGCDTISEVNDTSPESKVEKSGFMESESKVEGAIFMKLENYGYGSVVVDSETNVEYWLSEGVHNSGTLTMLVDGSGRPKLRK